MKHTWFSAKNAEQSGYAIYLDLDGKEVHVTEVVNDETGDAIPTPTSKWDDLTYIGVVAEYVGLSDTRWQHLKDHGYLGSLRKSYDYK